MIRQDTRGRLKPWIAPAVTAGCVGLLYGANFALTRAVSAGILGQTAAALILWALAISAFLLVLTRFCLACVYELDGVKISFYRIYIRNPRQLETILLREIQFFGEVEPSARYRASTRRFTSSRSGCAVRALVYKREGKYRRILFNPNDEIAARLTESVKKK